MFISIVCFTNKESRLTDLIPLYEYKYKSSPYTLNITLTIQYRGCFCYFYPILFEILFWFTRTQTNENIQNTLSEMDDSEGGGSKKRAVNWSQSKHNKQWNSIDHEYEFWFSTYTLIHSFTHSFFPSNWFH